MRKDCRSWPRKLRPCKKVGITRNWIAYLCESLVTSGVMPTWEAATYLTENLFGESPNPRLLGTSNAYEVTSQFLHRLYQPLVEAASRDITLPHGAMLHVFTDISLTGKSAVLVVYFPAEGSTASIPDAGRRQSLGSGLSGFGGRLTAGRKNAIDWLRSALTAAIGKPSKADRFWRKFR